MKRFKVVSLGLALVIGLLGISAALAAAIPPPDHLSLYWTPSSVMSINKCGVTARPYFGGNTNFTYSGWPIDFVLVSGSGSAPASGVTDINGVYKTSINAGQTVRAETRDWQGNVMIASNNYTCIGMIGWPLLDLAPVLSKGVSLEPPDKR